MVIKSLCFALALTVSSVSCHAESPAYSHAVFVSDIGSFAVSAVLRKSSKDIVIKLVQSIEKARSEEEAVGQFSRKIQDEYPGYAIWDTVVMPVPRKSCETRVSITPHLRP